MSGNEINSYCREIETYLCRKNDGHLIRVVGPSFELVSRWAADGVPLKVAFRGIDRYFERYYHNGPRRRPVKIDFCEADVLDVFDEWRRATGVVASPMSQDASSISLGASLGSPVARRGRGPSLPEHLERVVIKLTSARAAGSIGAGFDDLLDGAGRELERARSEARGLRGAARHALVERLAALDRELIAAARASLTAADLAALEREAEEDLSGFRMTMTADAFARARAAATDRLVRERLNLPVIAFTP